MKFEKLEKKTTDKTKDITKAWTFSSNHTIESGTKNKRLIEPYKADVTK